MGKLAFWILIALAALLVLRVVGSLGQKSRGRDRAESGGRDGARPAAGGSGGDRGGEAEPPRPAGELMMACAVCGVHVPGSDAVFARGRVYCGAEHRDQDGEGGAGHGARGGGAGRDLAAPGRGGR